MGLKNRKNVADKEVTSIRNDYVRSIEQKEKLQQAHKVRLYRRLTVFSIVVALCFVWIASTIYAQTKTLAEKEQLREEALVALEEVEKEQVQLKEQIELLNDEEYLAKLARKEYFLSEDGEIIFSIPDMEENQDGKE